MTNLPETAAASESYPCLMCGYSYDEALGDPAGGVPPGTKWMDVPASWTCPECGVGKDAFAQF